jgi:hypothetical protein
VLIWRKYFYWIVTLGFAKLDSRHRRHHHFLSKSMTTEQVVYRRTATRVYSLNGRCAEEVSRAQDFQNQTDELRVTRVMDNQRSTLAKHRTLHDETDRTMTSWREVSDTVRSPAQFDHDWMQRARQFLPPYTTMREMECVDDQWSHASGFPHHRQQGNRWNSNRGQEEYSSEEFRQPRSLAAPSRIQPPAASYRHRQQQEQTTKRSAPQNSPLLLK